MLGMRKFDRKDQCHIVDVVEQAGVAPLAKPCEVRHREPRLLRRLRRDRNAAATVPIGKDVSTARDARSTNDQCERSVHVAIMTISHDELTINVTIFAVLCQPIGFDAPRPPPSQLTRRISHKGRFQDRQPLGEWPHLGESGRVSLSYSPCRCYRRGDAGGCARRRAPPLPGEGCPAKTAARA